MKIVLSIILALSFYGSLAQIKVDDFIKAGEKDHAIGINRAFRYIDSVGQGKIEFNGLKTYNIYQCLELPKYHRLGKRLIIIEGNGCKIKAKSDTICIFNRMPNNQKTALNKYMSTRFVIQNFSFVGGRKAINLGASYGSKISFCNFIAQKEAAVDIQFGLNSIIEHCHATAAVKYNFRLRTGYDWGGTAMNSQSNHSVIQNCKVYASKTAHSAYDIQGSGGCVVRDCISEGHHEIEYGVHFDDLGSAAVKLFEVKNFHIEHAPRRAGIFIKNKGTTNISGVFYQHSGDTWGLLRVNKSTGTIRLTDIPWYVSGSVIKYESQNTKFIVDNCHPKFSNLNTWRLTNSKKWVPTFPKKLTIE